MIRKFQQEVCPVTLSIYKQCKMVVGMTGRGKVKTIEMRKHIDNYRLFVEGYESGVVKRWMDFFKQP